MSVRQAITSKTLAMVTIGNSVSNRGSARSSAPLLVLPVLLLLLLLPLLARMLVGRLRNAEILVQRLA